MPEPDKCDVTWQDEFPEWGDFGSLRLVDREALTEEDKRREFDQERGKLSAKDKRFLKRLIESGGLSDESIELFDRLHQFRRMSKEELSAMSADELRFVAHELFDYLWKSGIKTRERAYELLSKRMGLPIKRCHFSRMSEEELLRAVTVLQEKQWWKRVNTQKFINVPRNLRRSDGKRNRR